MPDHKSTDWPQAMATVLSCTYTARAGRAIAFGLQSRKHFRIAYNYWLDGQLLTGELYSEKAMPQGSIFPVHYDPALPRKSRHTKGSTLRPLTPLLAFGVAGSVILSLAWLSVLRGCS